MTVVVYRCLALIVLASYLPILLKQCKACSSAIYTHTANISSIVPYKSDMFGLQDEVEIFFSAHGVPVSYVEEAGDPYKEEMEQCISLIMQELQRRHISNHHTLAYQSRVGPVQWLQPYTDTTIKYASTPLLFFAVYANSWGHCANRLEELG